MRLLAMNLSILRLLLVLWMPAAVTPSVLAQDDLSASDQESVAEQESVPDAAATETGDITIDTEEADAAELAAQATRTEQLKQLREDAAALQAQLAELSSQFGFYDLSLVEVQNDLGRVYLEMGEYAEASDILTQALQLTRINSGLYDSQQIPVLEQLVAAHKAQSDWEDVSDYQHLVFSLQSRTYDRASPEFADAVLNMGEWQLIAARSNLEGRPGTFQKVEQLTALKELYADVRIHAEERQDLGRQWELLYASALTDVELVRQFLYPGMNEMMIAAPRYVTQTVCRMVPDGAGGAQRVCWQQSVSNPDYHHQVSRERGIQLDRARSNLQASQREMQALLDNNPAFASANIDRADAHMRALNNVLRDIQREERSTRLRSWW